MKLPFDFGIKLAFRLVLPGFVLALAFTPGVFAVANWFGLETNRLEVIGLGTFVWGWAITLADQPIYMIYEGRRFWPPKPRKWGIQLERRRLDALKRKVTDDVYERDPRLYLESAIEISNFPLNPDSEPEVRFPTRIGNLIEAYETYPFIKYGADAIFYWPRLWSVLSKDLREEIDNRQALADSSIYVSFALWLSTAPLICYVIASAFVASFPHPAWLLLLAVGCAGAAYLIYRVSLLAHAQFGEFFKAVFDQYLKEINVDDVVEKVSDLAGDATGIKRPSSQKYLIASRYLRWNLIRPPTEQRNYLPEEWRREVKRREDAAKSTKARSVTEKATT